MDERSRLDCAGGSAAPVPSPSPSEIEERVRRSSLRVDDGRARRGDVGQQAVVESRRIGAMKRSRAAAPQSLEEDGSLCPRRDDCAGDRREFAPAQAAQNFERIFKMTGVHGERMIDSLRLPADSSQHRPLNPRQPVAPLPPKIAADIAAAAVEPPTPILASAMRSTPSVTASMPNAMVAAQPRSSSAAPR